MTSEEFLKDLKIINDATRLSIMQMLSKNGTMCGCKILDELNITQGTLSHHMKLMTVAGFVSCRREGKWCHYTLVVSKMKELSTFIEDFSNPSLNKPICECK